MRCAKTFMPLIDDGDGKGIGKISHLDKFTQTVFKIESLFHGKIR